MARNILELKKKAIHLGVCDKYSELWDNARNNLDLFHLACSVQGADFICSAIHNDYFISKEYLIEQLGRYINGKALSRQNGYDGVLYVGGGTIKEIVPTLIIAIYGDYEIRIPEYAHCQIFLAGNSNVDIYNDGDIILSDYGKDSNVKIHGIGKFKMANPMNSKTSFIHKK